MSKMKTKDIITIAQKYFNCHNINLNEKNIGIAYSSGVDSSVLLSVMLALKTKYSQSFNLSLIHVNYNLRGSDSIDDMFLAKRIALKHSIPIYIKEVEKSVFDNENLQLKARTLRYNFFEEVKGEAKLDYILLAHHKDDLLEGIIYKMCRGAGTEIIKSMRRQIKYFLRPLIDVYKEDILLYADDNSVEYREDFTNKKNVYSRNKIRNVIVPSLSGINRNAKDNIINFCDRVYKETRLLRQKVKIAYKESFVNKKTIDTNKLAKYKRDVQSKVLIKFLVKNQIEPTEKRILEVKKIIASSRQNIHLPIDSFVLVKRYHEIEIKKPVESKTPLSLNIASDGVYLFNGVSVSVKKCLSGDIVDFKDMSVICLKADYPVNVRTRLDGDYIKAYPSGEKHSVRKLLIDSKVPLEIRNTLPLICKDDSVVGLYMKCYALNRIDYQYAINESDSFLQFTFGAL